MKNPFKEDIKKHVIIGLLVVFLSPFAIMSMNWIIGFASTPKEVKAEHDRITKDSIVMADSCRMFRMYIYSLSYRISETENDNRKIKTKLKIK